jgi:hypothetical protein
MSELRQAAYYYIARNWPVFPCVARGKTPLTQHGCRDATTLERQITAWWSRWPNANVGIATGAPSGLLVVDLDGKEGLASWADLEATHGVTATLEQATGGGGIHLVFAYPAEAALGNSVGRLGPGIDTRGQGGYILAAPSMHPSGRRYAWRDDSLAPAPCPPWLVELLKPPPPRTAQAALSGWRPGDDQRQLARFRGLLDVMAAARPRQRNDKLYWCACRLGELLAEGAPPAWIEVLVEAGVATGLGEAEVRKTIKSGLGAELP